MKITTLLFSVSLAVFSTLAHAAEEVIGKIGYMNGTLVAQRMDGTLKVLAPKSDVFAGDLLITAKSSYAQVKMNDGTLMTLRPNSNLRIEGFQFHEEAPEADNAVFRLLKGGLRSLTGLIGKRGNKDAYQMRAATATIGIRGTDFSARLCATQGCQDEDEETTKPPIKIRQAPVVGRVMLVKGELSAQNGAGEERKLILGGTVYEGDTLITGNKAFAIVAFRDEGRVSLQQNTRFQVEQFQYGKTAEQENAVWRLFKGGVRVVTGLIGRTKRDNYQFKMATATIGIRGTGFDAWCNGPCAEGADNPGATQNDPLDGAGVYVWAGEIAFNSPTDSFNVATQQAAILARDTGKPIAVVTVPAAIIDNDTPRPDSISVDMEKEFGSEANAGESGLYVTVHDGQVILTQEDKTLDLSSGETGYSNKHEMSRLATTPEFMGSDEQIDIEASSKSKMGSAGCTIEP